MGIFADDSEFKKRVKGDFDWSQAQQEQSDDIAKFVAEKQAFIERQDAKGVEDNLDLSGSQIRSAPVRQEPATQLHIEDNAFDLDLPAQKPQPVQPVAAAPVIPKKQPIAAKSGGFRDTLIDWLRTGLYAVIFFLIGYIVINFQAYYDIGLNVYYDITNQERDSVLRTFTANQPVDELAQAAEPVGATTTIPAFDMEIVPPGTRVILPRLGKNVPVVPVDENNLINRDWAALENDLQEALRDGVVHYPGTPWPGQSGNVVLTGHSSYYPWDSGRFKDVFAVLHNLNDGDEIVVFHNQRKYNYVVETKNVVLPQDVNVLGDTGDDRLTLLTCTPVGTNLKRLIVTARPLGEAT